MKYMKIFKLLGIAIILSLLIVAIPASPALAANVLASPNSGQIGDVIAITGSGFIPTTAPADGVVLYFSNQPASITESIGTHVTVYKTVAAGVTTGVTGSFIKNITIPNKFDNNSDVTSGTHYIYACQPGASLTIVGIATFSVVGGNITLSPLTGIVDSPLVVTGTSFAASQPVTIQFDGITVIIEEGSTSTNTSGGFSSTIYIPESKAGLHDITATVAGYPATAQFTVEPDILIFPQSGEAEDSVSISGTGFARRPAIVDIYFNNTYIQQVQTDTLGSFYIAAFVIPDLDLSQGSYFIEAEDGDQNLATAAFTLNAVTPPTTPPTTTPPTTTPPDNTDLSISTSGDAIGSLIGIGGAGFTPNGTAVLSYDGLEVTTTTIEPNGSFLVTFQAPPSAGGDHIITVTDGINTTQVTYTVETTPPSTPLPLLPEMGATVDSPFNFDWESVTDDSSPVTYTLQVSSDSSFSATSIVLEKTMLEVSEYSFTEEEELDLEGKETPYYWRIKAVDAASNGSPWSGLGEFYVPLPFSFPTWAIILLSVFGALFVFGLGYWVGRRTAFFY